MFKKIADKFVEQVIPWSQWQRKKSAVLFDFSKVSSFKNWETWSDSIYKGSSTAFFESVKPLEEAVDGKIEGNFARFHGAISTKLPEKSSNPRRIVRSGFAATNIDIPWYAKNLRDFDVMEIILRSDGRKYNVNITPKSYAKDDLYQGYIQCKPEDKGEWIIAKLPLKSLVLLGQGKPKAIQRGFDHGDMDNFGFSLADKQDGPFQLDIKTIRLYDSTFESAINEDA